MSRVAAVVLVAALALACAPAALGHEEGTLTAAQRHAAADLAGVPMRVLERRVDAVARRLGYRPGTRRARARAAGAPSDPGVVGQWSPVIPAAVVPIFEALLPDGKILMWDSVGDNATESYPDQSFTRAAVYDPVTNTSKRVDEFGFNIFCAGFVQLANGNVFVAGGNLDQQLDGIRQTHIFDWRTETWSRGPDMQDGRWYPGVAALPNEEAVIVGGGPTEAEVRTTSGSLRQLTGFVTPSARAYPFMQTSTDGRALLAGPGRTLSLGDTFGLGALTAFGARDSIQRTYGSYAEFDVGRFLVAGGGSVSEDGLTGVPTRTATVVDTRGPAPVAAPTSSMAVRRRQFDLTVLADGSVLATGGMSTNANGGLVDLANPVYTAERWDPATGAWTQLAPASVVREYHSTALLLPDARVLTGGGGICGACQSLGYLRKDMEIFSPPYLFRHDGTGALAPRPAIGSHPSAITYDSTFSVSSNQAAQIRKVALVRLGAPTHGADQSQRYVPLPFTVAGTKLTVSAPNNPNEAPPGHYMLFLVDASGVPSVAPIVSVQRPAPLTDLALGRPATGSAPCQAGEGADKAVNGTVTGGLDDKWCSAAAQKRIDVDLGSAQKISRFVVRHAGAGGEPASLDTRAFRFRTSPDGTTWTTVAIVTGNTADVTTTTIATRKARYVRLAVDQGEQTGTTGAARIYELEVYGTARAPAPGPPLVAYSGQGFAGRAQRFEAGAYDAARGNLALVGDDAIRSVQVAPGYQAQLCRGGGLTDCTTLLAGGFTAMPSGFDLAVSSLRVAPAP